MLDHLLLPHQNRVPEDFTLQRESIVIPHYQLYAVEKYIIQRTPFRHLLVVYTGDPAHSVTFDAFSPSSQSAWASTIATLRADGAKPKATSHGVLLVTSLAHFRSDYNIVKIPTGNFLSVREQLYANVDLLRMGCFGRTALTLEDPSDVTKERFISTFCLPENTITPVPNPASVEHLPQTSPTRPPVGPRRGTGISGNSANSLPSRASRDNREKVVIGKTKDPVAFVPTVLELIKLIQAGLAIFGLFPEENTSVQPGIVLDGLLCDNTVKGIKKWITRVGGPCLGLEKSERYVDPRFVAGLISTVLTVRNQLAYLGYSYYLPRDPFLHPYTFACTINSYIQSTAPPSIAPTIPAQTHHHHTFVSPSHSVYTSTPIIPAAPPANSVLSAAAAAAASLASSFAAPVAATPSNAVVGAVLTRDSMETLRATYDSKQRSESRKVRRVIKNKLAAAVESDGDGAGNVLALALTKSLSDGEREPTSLHHQSLSLSAGATSGGSDVRQGVLGGLGSSLASGMRGGGAALANAAGVGGTGDSNASIGDPGTLYIPTLDLGAFTLFVVGRSGLKPSHGRKTGVDGVVSRTKDRAKRMSRDIGKIGTTNAIPIPGSGIYGSKNIHDPGSDSATAAAGVVLTYAYETERSRAARDVVVASSVKALWSGRVYDLVRMREDVEAAGADGPERWSTNSGATPPGVTTSLLNGSVPGAGTGVGWTGAAGWGSTSGNTTGTSPGNAGAADGKRWLSGLKADKVVEKDGDDDKSRQRRGLSPSSMASDVEEGPADTGKRGRAYDGRSTEEESDVLSLGMGGSSSFGGMQWPGRMRGKLGDWAGKARRKGQSTDLTATSSLQSGLAPSRGHASLAASTSNSVRSNALESVDTSDKKTVLDSPQSSVIHTPSSTPYNSHKTESKMAQSKPSRLQTTGLGNVRPSIRSATSGYMSASASRAQSPTLPPMSFSGDGDRDVDDDDLLLSSGQVSPFSDDRPNHFGMVSDDNTSIIRRRGASMASSTTNLAIGAAGSSLAGAENDTLDAKLLMLAQQKQNGDRKRPWFGRSMSHPTRVASWADPLSAREEGEDGLTTPMIYSDEDENESLAPRSTRMSYAKSKDKRRKSNERDLAALSVSEEDMEGEEESDVSRLGGYLAPHRHGSIGGWKRSREKARFHSLLSIVDDGGVLVEEPLEDSEDEELEEHDYGDDMQATIRRRRMFRLDANRRRSFHDLDSLREIEALPLEYMKIDVSMCGQMLIIHRRAEHLRNVIDCIRLLSNSLSETNAGLREHYESHMPTMPEIEERVGVLAELDIENARAERIFQATNTLSYETQQFRVGDLWQTASPSRRKVFEMREKVFGAGGRRLPAGLHGAHGPYNRMQWTLDGDIRLVDHLGRTESEAEEEEELDRGPRIRQSLEEMAPEEEEGEEGNVVKHPNIKPMWLLRFFTSWGARWSAAASSIPAPLAPASDGGEDDKAANNVHSIPDPASHPNSPPDEFEKVPIARSATHPT